ncbi:hypothetical protein MYX77_14495, partial [Acidobacteriia bacterium AH_259_A11_L15]|nr:hypothetical protein [Acidobacteriia bacterium AH_259_A11_L15]
MARQIFLSTLEEVEVPCLFERKLERRGNELRFGNPSAALPSAPLGTGGTGGARDSINLDAFKSIWVFSFGKAAWATFRALCDA